MDGEDRSVRKRSVHPTQVLAWLFAGWILAQACTAGPPLITNDPDTPGDRHWEINLAAAGASGPGSSELALPDADINYGVGEHVQLSVHVPWMLARESGKGWSSGLGPVEFAVRWRFLDEETAGIAMAVQPHWESSWSQAAIRRGVASPNDTFGIPLQAARTFGAWTIGGELSRNFVEREADAWEAGAYVSHACGKGSGCLAELHAERPDGGGVRVAWNLGLTHPINPHLVLLGSVGRAHGGEPGDRAATLFYLGVQLLR